MEKAIIFNIQRYSLHDGGGIRTVVFFKGCPLRCPWCSNPESQSFTPEIMRKQSMCIGCSSKNAFECLQSADFCPTGALELVGRPYTIKEVVEEVKKDIPFYETTSGGVTLSGGEVLSQGIFAIELLKELKKLGLNTAIETTGMANWEIINKITDYLDTVLWDFKIMDKEKAQSILNADIELIKSNFTKLISKKVKVIPRIPLIPGYTAEKENLDEIIEFISSFPIKEVHILPFHQYGSSKYKALGREYKLANWETLSKEEIESIRKSFESKGLVAIIGGY